MAFDRLQGLGKEKFTKIVGDLVRGVTAADVARMIHKEWGLFTDVKEKSLTQQLNRLRAEAAKGMFGETIAAEIVENHTVSIPALVGVSMDSLSRMEEVANIQRDRFLQARKAEVEGKKLGTEIGPIINSYSDLVQDMQEMRFKLGADEFKGPMPGVPQGFRAGMQKTTIAPDGTKTIDSRAIEAYAVLNDLFDQRGIPAKTVES